MLDLRYLCPQPAGFGACASCPFVATATPALCFACANEGVPDPPGPGCPVCQEPLGDEGVCANTVCTLPDRGFTRVYTVSGRPEELWRVLYRYKYDEEREWAAVLARVLAGFLEAQRAELARFSVITTGALYIGPRAARLWDYLRPVLEPAAEGSGLQVAHDVLVKSGPTPRFMGLGVEERRAIAEGSLRDALSVPDPARVAGQRGLVFDDVYSEGFSLREMARALLAAGAVEVAGVVLTRRKGG